MQLEHSWPEERSQATQLCLQINPLRKLDITQTWHLSMGRLPKGLRSQVLSKISLPKGSV